MNTTKATYPLRGILIEFTLRDKDGITRNFWRKRFRSEKRALSYFNKLKAGWQGEREASMLVLQNLNR